MPENEKPPARRVDVYFVIEKNYQVCRLMQYCIVEWAIHNDLKVCYFFNEIKNTEI